MDISCGASVFQVLFIFEWIIIFEDRKPTLFEKEEKDVSLVFEIPLHARLANPLDPLNIYPLHSGGSSNQFQYISIVHLRGVQKYLFIPNAIRMFVYVNNINPLN